MHLSIPLQCLLFSPMALTNHSLNMQKHYDNSVHLRMPCMALESKRELHPFQFPPIRLLLCTLQGLHH